MDEATKTAFEERPKPPEIPPKTKEEKPRPPPTGRKARRDHGYWHRGGRSIGVTGRRK